MRRLTLLAPLLCALTLSACGLATPVPAGRQADPALADYCAAFDDVPVISVPEVCR